MSVKRIISELNTAALAARLISIESYSFMENQEQAIAEHILDIFRAEGIDAQLQTVSPGRPNVIAKIPGSVPGAPSLMLCGHMDTVPGYDMDNAFSPVIRDGVLHGRGACDMKGAVAAMITAMLAIKRSDVRLSGDLVFAGLADEEEGGTGAEYIAANGPFTTAAIIGEPTELEICLGHKGLEWIRIDIAGKKVHGGSQKLGINAIEMASRLVSRIYEKYIPVLDTCTHPVLGEASINVGRIEGGDQPSTVAGSCTLYLDRRTTLGETREQAYAELREICAGLHAEDSRFSATVSDLMAGKTTIAHEPFCVDANDPVVLALSDAMRDMGREPVLTAFHAWSDAGTLRRCTECVPVVCGPGELKLAHSINDSVKVSELDEAALLYANAAIQYLS